MTDSTDHTLEFEFSIRAHLKQAWRLFKEHGWYFVGLAAVLAILNVMLDRHTNGILRLLAGAATMVWSYVTVSSALAAVDGKSGMLSFEALKLHLPSWHMFWQFLVVIFASAIIITGGLVLLIIPGVYFMVRLMFSNFAVVDRKEGIVPSMRYSWRLVQKDIFWTSLLCLVIAMALIFIGVLFIGIGVLVTYPVSLIFLALLYRELTKLSLPDVEPAPVPAPAAIEKVPEPQPEAVPAAQ